MTERAPTSNGWSRGAGFWLSFGSILLPLLLSALEGTVTNTALPTISESLNLGTKFSWVATAFLLSSTLFQPLYGQLADIWGRKYPTTFSVLVFLLGSAICGWARSGAALIVGRVIQGLGTGGIDLFTELILCDLVPLRQRGAYTAVKHAVFAIGTAVGPVLGGVFAEHDWRWCFWINIPVCVVAIALLIFGLRVENGSDAKQIRVWDQFKRIDFVGTAVLTASVILFLVALSFGGASHAWQSPLIILCFAFGLVGFIFFGLWESSKFCKHPIMPPQVFSNRTSAAAFALTTIHGFLTYGFQFYLPPFFQAVKSSTPSRSGIEVLPTTLVIVVLAAIGGPLLTVTGKYRPIHQAGFVSMAIGLGLCIMLSKDTQIGCWVLYQLLVAAGSGIIVSTTLPAVVADLHDNQSGAAAGSWAFLRGTGSLFGVAIPGAAFNSRFKSLVSSIDNTDARSQISQGQAYQHATSAFVGKFGETVKQQIIGVFTESLKLVWIILAVLAGIGFIITFFEKQIPLRKELDTKFGLKDKSTSSSISAGEETPASNDAQSQKDIEVGDLEAGVDEEKVESEKAEI